MRRISRIQEFFRLLPRGAFDQAVRRRDADRYCKSFSSWNHLVVMGYAQLSGAVSLREIETGFNAQSNHHFHLGVGAVRRTTLADANARRDPGVFADLARTLMGQVRRKLRSQCTDLLYLLGSSTVSLKGRGFDEWAAATRVRSTQGLKLHVAFEGRSQLPCWLSLTPPNVNDLTEARRVELEAAATYVFDKAYCDFNWWQQIDERGARFVSRFKRNVRLTVLEQRSVPVAGEILSDEVVEFAHRTPGGGRTNLYVKALRRVSVAREGKAPLVLASNDLHSPAAQIAALYKQRWGVELFFKWIKQHLNIKQFCAKNDNAVRIQILTALITYLLLALHKERTGSKKTLWMWLVELSASLFQRQGITHDNTQFNRRRRQIHQFKSAQQELFPCYKFPGH